MTIPEMLDRLAELQSAVDMLNLQKRDLIDNILTPEVKRAIAEIETEFSGQAEAVAHKINTLEAEIKAAVIENGATIKSAHLQAVYTKGRVTWDGSKLEGMMALIPGLREARREGQPSVAIRKIG